MQASALLTFSTCIQLGIPCLGNDATLSGQSSYLSKYNWDDAPPQTCLESHLLNNANVCQIENLTLPIKTPDLKLRRGKSSGFPSLIGRISIWPAWPVRYILTEKAKDKFHYYQQRPRGLVVRLFEPSTTAVFYPEHLSDGPLCSLLFKHIWLLLFFFFVTGSPASLSGILSNEGLSLMVKVNPCHLCWGPP